MIHKQIKKENLRSGQRAVEGLTGLSATICDWPSRRVPVTGRGAREGQDLLRGGTEAVGDLSRKHFPLPGCSHE